MRKCRRHISFFYEFSIVTNLNGSELDDLVRLYPNPSFELLITDAGLNISKIFVFNSSGHTMTIIQKDSHTLNISELERGVYLIKLVTEEGEINKKFVKL